MSCPTLHPCLNREWSSPSVSADLLSTYSNGGDSCQVLHEEATLQTSTSIVALVNTETRTSGWLTSTDEHINADVTETFQPDRRLTPLDNFNSNRPTSRETVTRHGQQWDKDTHNERQTKWCQQTSISETSVQQTSVPPGKERGKGPTASNRPAAACRRGSSRDQCPADHCPIARDGWRSIITI